MQDNTSVSDSIKRRLYGDIGVELKGRGVGVDFLDNILAAVGGCLDNFGELVCKDTDRKSVLFAVEGVESFVSLKHAVERILDFINFRSFNNSGDIKVIYD